MNPKEPNAIHKQHRQRLRERYESNGVDGFADHELLELLLGYTHAQKDTNPLGHELINRFGNLQGVFEASKQELLETPDIGEYSAFLLNLIPGLCRRYFTQLYNGELRMTTPMALINFFIPRFIGHREECFYAAFLDQNQKLIRCSLQYMGTVNAVEICAERILQTARLTASSYVVVAHNHFTDSIPSTKDIETTRALITRLEQHNIVLLDHIVICGSTGTSMRQSGHMDKAR